MHTYIYTGYPNISVYIYVCMYVYIYIYACIDRVIIANTLGADARLLEQRAGWSAHEHEVVSELCHASCCG